MIITKVIQNGSQNLSIRILGEVAKDDLEIIDLVEATKGHNQEISERMKLASALWIIQEKLGITLYWGGPPTLDRLLFPMESRNSVRFDQGLRAPVGWDKTLVLECFGFVRDPVPVKRFSLTIDLDR